MTRRIKKGFGYMDDYSDIRLYRRSHGGKWFKTRHSGVRVALDLPGPGNCEFVELLCLNTTRS